jgi:8-amino-7-oxononanoate synthase
MFFLTYSNEKLLIENPLTQKLTSLLKELSAHSAVRTLSNVNGLVDFCSNDYLGLAQNRETASSLNTFREDLGATGSRLVSGNKPVFEAFERYLSNFHCGEAALIFNSAYMANIGLLSALVGREDTIIYDEYSHASIRDGIKLSCARSARFKHNDICDLREKLKTTRGQIVVVVESLYSMDGDFCPLVDVVTETVKAGGAVIVDEAHSTGLYGLEGAGYTAELGLSNDVFARVHGWGKAVGRHGGCVVGSRVLCDWLINKARPFIYSTAPAPRHIQEVWSAYEVVKTANNDRSLLQDKIIKMAQTLNAIAKGNVIGGTSPIFGVRLCGNDEVQKTASWLQDKGFGVVGIRSPTVPQGQERIRICVHSYNTTEEIDALGHAIQEKALCM